MSAPSTSSGGACPRCKRAAHGGSCAAPQPMAPAPQLAGVQRQLANVRPAQPRELAQLSAARLEMAQSLADRVAQRYGRDRAWRDAWYLEYLRACATGDSVRARALCLELDPAEPQPGSQERAS